ncbi:MULTISPECIES: hypothetical protein [Methylobacterium]|uniref:hypothetical protein n=1 Tax=Methylobacterium TaxID=407 RepID=UPI0013EBDE58|nr:hypothetical protein [Methylobacterium sp. DB0501]NGM33330.1 hypothetical protein [Methylobacterium sp. DB0501]
MSGLTIGNFGAFREQLLQSAKWASRQQPNIRADIIRTIIKNSTFDDHSALIFDYSFELVSEAEIFEAAYSDVSGSEYFQGWLQDECEDINRTIDLLALHLAKQAETGADWRVAHKEFRDGSLAVKLRSAFISAAKSKCDWISCSDTRIEFHNRWLNEFINFGPKYSPVEIQVKRLSAIKWMCEQPWYAIYVPDAMRCIVSPSGANPKKQADKKIETPLPAINNRKPGRGKDSGLQRKDRLLFPKIDEMLKNGQASSPNRAAIMIGPEIAGPGTLENRALRVARLYRRERKRPS